jgi:hypothetical protein
MIDPIEAARRVEAATVVCRERDRGKGVSVTPESAFQGLGEPSADASVEAR